MSAYLIGGQRWTSYDVGFTDELAAAYLERRRPLCLCLAEGVAMYVARLGARFIIKRMPGTGILHATDCVSYELPADLSGLQPVIGSAITENPESGITSLKLGFAMSKVGTRAIEFRCDGGGDSMLDGSIRLTLGDLLHYLWDQAELTRWQPGIRGPAVLGDCAPAVVLGHPRQGRGRSALACSRLHSGSLQCRAPQRDRRTPVSPLDAGDSNPGWRSSADPPHRGTQGNRAIAIRAKCIDQAFA